MQEKVKELLIAPCGMNCGLCLAYQREKAHCAGCRAADSDIHKGCQKCIIRACPEISSLEKGFCFECGKYPCRRLKQLDKRYKSKYYMSMLENLEFIRARGIDEMLENEWERWKCPACGEALCVHRRICRSCGYEDAERPGLRI